MRKAIVGLVILVGTATGLVASPALAAPNQGEVSKVFVVTLPNATCTFDVAIPGAKVEGDDLGRCPHPARRQHRVRQHQVRFEGGRRRIRARLRCQHDDHDHPGHLELRPLDVPGSRRLLTGWSLAASSQLFAADRACQFAVSSRITAAMPLGRC